MSSNVTGARGSSRPVASRSAATTAAVETTVGGSPTPLTPYGASGSGSSMSTVSDRRHVERGRDQVVGEARVRDQAVAGLDLLHQREAEALGDPALDLALDRLRVDRAADLLRGADPDDAGEAELDVDLGDDAHRGNRERDVGALAGDLARSRGRAASSAGGGRRARRRPRRRRCASRSASAARQASRTAPETI